MAIDLKLLGQKLLTKYPELAKTLINEALLNDISILPTIREEIESSPKFEVKTIYESRELIIAIILKLYDPDYLEGKKYMKKGLRKALSNLFNCSPNLISYLSQKVNNLMFIYRSFEAECNYFVGIIAEKYGDRTRQKELQDSQ